MNRTATGQPSRTVRAQRRRSSASLALAVVAIGSLLVAACGDPSKSPAPSGAAAASPGATSVPAATPAGPPPELKIPAAPAAAAAPTGSIDDQAAALAKAVAPGGQAALAPLLAAYRAAGIPVIGGDGHPLAGFDDDQVGPGWWQVWLSAGGNPEFTVSLNDATKLLVAMPDAPSLDTAAVATAALADLRTMATDPDAHRHFFARFLAESSNIRSGADALAPATTTADVRLSPIATEFFIAGLLRSVAIAAVRANPAIAARPMLGIASIGRPLPLGLPDPADGAAGNPCNPSGDPEAVSFWTQWIASKLTGGLNLPGMDGAMKSAVDLVIKNASVASKVGKAAAVLGGAIAALTFMLQMATLKASSTISPNPLVRTHLDHPHGYEATITTILKYDLEGKSLDGGVGVKNCLLVFLNALGIQATLPADGAVEGAKLTYKGGEGFGERMNTGEAFVQFPDQEEISKDTGPGGIRTITVQGIYQKKTIPDSAVEWIRDASVVIKAQPEAENGRSLANMFWDSFVALGAGPVGGIAPIIDTLKSVEFNLGEYPFKVKDWQPGWILDAKFDDNPMIGQKCDGLEGRWTLDGATTKTVDTKIHITVDIPKGMHTGTYDFRSITTVKNQYGTIVSTLTGSDEATVTPQKDGSVLMILLEGQGKVTAVGAGTSVTTPIAILGQQFTWQPQRCDEPGS